MPYEMISATGGSAIYKTFNTTRTQSLTATAVGNCWLAAIAATTTLTAPTGGNCTWQKMCGPNQNTGGTPLVNFELWLGTATSTSSSNMSINTSTTGQYGGYFKEFTCEGVSSATVWGSDTGTENDKTTKTNTTIPFPSLTPLQYRRAYGGMCIVGSDVAASGQPSDYTVFRDSTFFNCLMWKPFLADMNTESPVLVQTANNDSYTLGALFWAQNPDSMWLPT